ncbi:phosphotransferase family protein [Dactylosporangium fulvum]|uniref:Phosphotransferase family protein n=1 Tax=Dactylosporangium fulvum TaxID=53359 RepID=A0ABY5W4G5_9ACTN|nr:phosphotransferase family protein [Dactylosporangium fulvum]UWP84354.1 phosphotransferase family protein [Dactylosporangium fulvum]
MTTPPGLDLPRLAAYLDAKAPGLVSAPLRAELVAGGRSNLTYVLNEVFVLRRPPLGHVLATAHDMAREYRVISALGATMVPVPEALLLCTDDSVLGAPFYLMARVPGVVLRNRSQTDSLGEDNRRRIAFAMMDTLAQLHLVDYAEVGLADFGRPEGFLERQVRRWTGQLDKSRSRDLPAADTLREQLAASIPASPRTGIVHGDYRLDNLIVDPDTLRVAAVLDWEMATIGDPLTDLGLLLAYWNVLNRLKTGVNPIADGLGSDAGFPTGDELLRRYARSAPLSDDLHWYVGLACYKLAIVLEGIHFRYIQGKTVGAGFDRIGELVPPLLEHGIAAINGES